MQIKFLKRVNEGDLALPDNENLVDFFQGKKVAEIDPLNADRFFVNLPEWNNRKNISKLKMALNEIVPSIEKIDKMTLHEMLASIRDLGMIVSSLIFHEVDPKEVNTDLEMSLFKLGQFTGMVPRETVFHYGFYNPKGERERTFTGKPAEKALISAARNAAPAINKTLEQLSTLWFRPIDSPSFSETCLAAGEELKEILQSISKAKSSIPPEFFANDLRPFFNNIIIKGESYNGASAAPLSIFLIDHIVWSSDYNDFRLRRFQRDQVKYNVPHWKDFYRKTEGKRSLMTTIRTMKPSQNLTRSIDAIHELLHTITSFRAAHLDLAKKAYNKEIRKFDRGSGGYGTDSLKYIFDLTHKHFLELKNLSN